MNGRRFTEGEWREFLKQAGAFLVTVTYEDRFGPLGKIAVLAGRRLPRETRIDVWVMSCRAFSRHIEFQVLRCLYRATATSELFLSFRETERNSPLREFLMRLQPVWSDDGLRLAQEQFAEACPELHHRVTETVL